MIWTVAPLAIGSPTTVLSLGSSLPTTTTLRSEGSTPGAGSFTVNDFARTVCPGRVVVVGDGLVVEVVVLVVAIDVELVVLVVLVVVVRVVVVVVVVVLVV